MLVIQTCVYGVDVAGWATIMVVMLLSSGLIMLMLGILGEYVYRALDASRNRPPFLIDEVRNRRKAMKEEESGAAVPESHARKEHPWNTEP